MKNPVHLAVPALLVLLAAFCHAEEKTQKIPSPDKKFVYEFVEPDTNASLGKLRVVSKKNGATLWQSPEIMNNSWVQTAKCIWSPDSKKFAVNFRAGGRYEITQVYRWNGKAFVETSSPEDLLTPRLDAAKDNQLRELVAKLPPSFPDKDAILQGSFQRRIWDNYRLRRWIDDNTAEVTAYSERTVSAPNTDEDGEDIFGSMRFVVRLDEKGQWNMLKEQNIPLEEAQDDNP